jgi:glyoxylase-like metal-dependent hydrolase (beta-lactamase superfamily II)
MSYHLQQKNTMKNTQIKLRLFDTGYCTVSEHQVLRGAPKRPLKARALVALLVHPVFGNILFDTGYAPRFFSVTKPWPERIYALLTPVTLAAEPLVVQLAGLGIGPSDIGLVILSHLHADHLGSLLDFPNTPIVMTKAAHDDFVGRNRITGLMHGYLPALLPKQLLANVRVVTDFNDAPLPVLGATKDLFNDGSLRLVPLPGHARGQVGLLCQTAAGPILLAADGAWHSRSMRDYREAVATIAKLHEFAKLSPETQVWPTHCPELTAALGEWI